MEFSKSSEAEMKTITAIVTGNIIGNGRFYIGKPLGHGGFGKTFAAVDILNKDEPVAIKVQIGGRLKKSIFSNGESQSCKENGEQLDSTSGSSSLAWDLETEFNVLLHMKNVPGFPKAIEIGIFKDETYLVMELCGSSLYKVFKKCRRIFSMKTLLILMDQLLVRLQMLHEKGMIHGDIKPDNMLLGTGNNSGIVYLIDFGLTTMYMDLSTGELLPHKINDRVMGTPIFMSIHAHNKLQQTRRNDMESLAYVMAYFIRHGELPWSKFESHVDFEGGMRNIKMSMTGLELFNGQPREFAIFYEKVKKLQYNERPDYEGYREMFRRLGTLLGINYKGDDGMGAKLVFN